MATLDKDPQISENLYKELTALVKGSVCNRTDAAFTEGVKTFNGKLIPRASVVVAPRDAEDVSKVIKFCRKHQLSPSVKAGGYGIAGWSVAGDIIIDMSLMRDIDIEPPQPVGEGEVDYTRIRDMPAQGSKGKARASGGGTRSQGPTILAPDTQRIGGAKRPREDDAHRPPPLNDTILRNYDAASPVVAQFLRGPQLPHEPGEAPRQPPTNRRRLHSPEPDNDHIPHLEMPPITTRQLSSESASSSTEDSSSGSSISRTVSTDTNATTPTDAASPVSGAIIPSHVSRITGDSDPFGYMAPASTSIALPPSFPAMRAFSGPLSLMPSLGAPGFMPTFPLGFGSSPSLQPGMTGIAPSRPVHSHAYVTFGAGMRQKEIDIFTAEHALEGISSVSGSIENGLVPYHIPTAAHPVGSSTMILAGFGFLSRMYGTSSDNLVEAEVVLADGSIIIINKDGDPDLWWAMRGAGPAFGIVTRYKAKAFPVPVCFAGNLIYRFHRATAPSLIKHFRDCIKGAPRELYANVLLTAGPADKDSLVVIQFCYLGPKEDGIPYLQAIASWDGERCLLNEVNEKSFLFQQDSIAQILRGKVGRQWFLRSSLIHSLPDDVIHETVIRFSNTPIGCTWIFELSGGAIADFEDTCLPKEQREAIWTVAALHQWDMGIDDPRCVTTAEEWMGSTIKPVSIGGPFPVFLGRHESASRTMASFGKNWDRLAALKRKYDPDSFFRNTFWPLDKDGKPIEYLYNEPASPEM